MEPIESLLDQRGDVGFGPGDGAKNPAATINRLDVADTDLQVAFAVFAAAYESKLIVMAAGRPAASLSRIAEPLADL